MADVTPDFAIDYGLLSKVQAKLRELADQAGTGEGTGAYHDASELSGEAGRRLWGSYDVAAEFRYFFDTAKGRQKDGKEGLVKMADLFKGVSEAWFEADSQIAGSAGLLAKSLGLEEWKGQKEAYDAWLAKKKAWDAFLQQIGAADYFRDHPGESIRMVCSAEDAPGFCKAWREFPHPPEQPGDAPPKPSDTPPTSFHQENETGSIDVKLELDKDNNIIKEITTVTTNGQTYTTTTAYDGPPHMVTPPGGGKPFDARDYTVTTTGADGTTSVSKVVINDDGSGTMSVTEGDEVKNYTRSGLGAEWELIDENPGDDEDSPFVG
ncbi:serine/arginine repetitive matrix protein 2 [Streptomyces sp. WAC06614]|uniref:serine/arginine repetitive matrix protein 2 n=1 Tax=Streptomyces sp. WAC06614 TaxID=2487416 RepID=UPI000F77CD40|nr:serine/arginine repetitive matrix protein 2 [Streptomyces sp. WAC06614]RSS78173.1 serine/arginine repetitive matrix protein 2 [Streptomyces sp. WAC06614]